MSSVARRQQAMAIYGIALNPAGLDVSLTRDVNTRRVEVIKKPDELLYDWKLQSLVLDTAVLR